MTTPTPKIIELSLDRREELLQRVEARLPEDDYETIKALLETYVYLTELLKDKGTTIERLRKLLFGAHTEKTRDVFPPTEEEAAAGNEARPDRAEGVDSEPVPTPKRKGHGRNDADAYRGAEKIEVPHESLHAGDACPDGTKGTVYNMAQPSVVIRIDYLTELPRHAEALSSTASMRMPWNYRETRKQTATPPALVRQSAHGKPDRPLPSTPHLPRRPRFCTPAEETQCEYDLTGNMSDVCPECGAAVACAAYR